MTGRPKPIHFEGVLYPNRMALARYLAPIVRRKPGAVDMMLRTHGDDGAAVIRRYGVPPAPLRFYTVAYCTPS